MIDPSIWEDEHFGQLSDKSKILFIACISNADDDGRLSGNYSHLRAIAFRFEEITTKKIEELVIEISQKMTNFKFYNVNGCQYIQLLKWEEYQTQRADRRQPSKHPSIPSMSDKCPSNVRQVSAQVKLSKDKISKDNNIDAHQIYELFIKEFNKNPNQYKLTNFRIKKIKTRLDDAGKEMLMKAIKNTAKSSFHRGENDRGWEADLDFILRTYEKTEQLANMPLKSFKAKDGAIFENQKDLEAYEKYKGKK